MAQGVGTIKRRQGRHREVGSEGSLSHSHDLRDTNRIVRPGAVGELATDSETRDSQDRPEVNPAGAGRKNGYLSREGCLPVLQRDYRSGNAKGRVGSSQQRP